tara:strand:- start:246 stop:863 length:618 start_codon:yes stop_codon:yes gene_type:complete
MINTKGDKFIPIEVLVNELKAGSGESLKRQFKKNLNPIKNPSKNKNNNYDKEVSGQEDIKSMIKKKIKKEKSNKITKESLQKSKINKSEEYQNSNNQINMGSINKNNENNISEKGSVKGKGKIKVTCLDCKTPKYPPKALRRGAEGSPLIKVWISTEGNVLKTIIIRSSAIESIDKAAIKAASESKFYPIQSNSTLNIEYNLKIR